METGQSSFKNMVWFMGVVEDINDPEMLNRVRVRCIGYHTADKTLMPTNNLPWAPFVSSTAQMSSPMVNQGDWVVGFFVDGEQAQQPVVLGSIVGKPESPANPNEGFYDPSGVHPRFPGEGTNPRHARGEVGTEDRNAVAYSRASATPNIPSADGSKFAEPISQFDARYPFNHVIETDGGNVIELDDTPNAERIQIFHRKGSFVEFHPDGSIVHRGAKDRYHIVFENENLYAGGNMNMSVVGAVNILAGANTNISTGGDATWRVGGNLRMDIGGNFDVAVGGTTNIDSGGTAIVYSGGNVELQGSQVHFNKPTPKPVSGLNAPTPIAKSSGGPTVFEIIAQDDDEPKTIEEYNAILTSAGLPPANTAPAVEGEKNTPPAGGEKKDVKCGSIKLQDDYSKVKVSKNFTLADFTQGGKRRLQSHMGVSEDEILCNIVKVAENICEPIRAAGIKFNITSCWRRPGDAPGSKATSDHNFGRAVDINVLGMSAYEGAQKIYPIVGRIAKQFLLEYAAGPGWLHIAYDEGNKHGLPQATFRNNSVYARNQFVDLKPGVRAG